MRSLFGGEGAKFNINNTVIPRPAWGLEGYYGALGITALREFLTYGEKTGLRERGRLHAATPLPIA
jgi:hypothetical protein